MNFTPEQAERLYKLGKLPPKFYFQLNGKSAQENYEAQRELILSQYKAPQIEINTEEAKEQIENIIQDLLENLKIDL